MKQMYRRLDPKTYEEEMAKAVTVQQHPQRRKGCIGIREWTVVSESGDSHVEKVGKHSIMKRTGLPARDLRVMDPMLSCPSTILGRERAIVINLEHIKAIVTAKELFIFKSTNPLVVQFINDLQDRVSSPNDIPALNNGDNNTTKRGLVVGHKLLPFEFRALEVCLESTCRCLESETQTLEQEAYPALDELSSKVSTLNLERVRQTKSRLAGLSSRTQKVRDELEHLLDDDNDMAEMYLTQKLLRRPSMEDTSGKEREELYNGELETDKERYERDKSKHSYETLSTVPPNVEEMEMLLEAYFARTDGISQNLAHMSEYVDGTEDYINIMLDDKQNQLLQMGVLLSCGNMMLNAGIMVVGLFGMNIDIPLFSATPKQFWETTFGTIGGCVASYLIIVGWARTNKLF